MSDAKLLLGRRAADGAAISLGASVLLRHVMALGSSGSGKTVFCKVVVEEAVRRGIPAICIDPQGDLCSLAAGTLEPPELEARGVDPSIARELAERAEVVIFTPGSSRGVPLCADPVDASLADCTGDARVEAITRTAGIVVGLLGFDLDADDGAGLAAVIDRALHELIDAGARPSLAALSDHLAREDASDFASYARYLDARKIRVACQRLARLDVGARRALFHDGVPIDVDVLLGRDPRAPVAEGKTRVAVVYLNTLHQQEDKEFFVAALAERLYAWMLASPSAEPQALFYVDEVAPFIPPVRKPACKEGLARLFKQARKYGVCCLMATQNPGDVDYKAMAQFATWALGRLTTRQDLKKIEPTVKSLAPVEADSIVARLPALKPGELVLLSPDQLAEPTEIRARWLATRHETWTEERIEEHTASLRARFASLAAPTGAPRAAVSPQHAADDGSTDGRDAASPPAATGGSAREVTPAAIGGAAEARDAQPAHVDTVVAELAAAPTERTSDRSDDRDAATLAALRRRPSARAKDLAPELAKSEASVRRSLERLVESGRARSFKQGRSMRYFAIDRGGRPDLDIPDHVAVLVANVGPEEAARIASTHERTKVLGVIGEDERFAGAEPLHRLVYKLDFEEKVERGVLARLFGPTHDEHLGSVYLHPHNLGVLLFTNEDGIRFDDLPKGPASAIRDFDGVTETQVVAPGALVLEDDDWRKRKPEAAVRESFRARFDATPREVSILFVPLWTLLFRGAAGSLRRVTIDALIGRPVRWLPP